MCHYPLWCVAVLDSYDDEMMVVCVWHYLLWCVAVLDSYDDEMMVVCVCHYPLWCVVVLDSYDDGDDGCVCVIILSGVLQCWTVMMMVMMVVCVSLSSLVCCSVRQL